MLVNGLVSSEGLGAEVELNELDYPSLYVANTLSETEQYVKAANSGGTSALSLGLTNVGINQVAPVGKLHILEDLATIDRTFLVYDDAVTTTGTALVEFKMDNSGASVPVLQVWNDGTGDSFVVKDGGAAVLTVADGGVVAIPQGVAIAPTTTGTMLDFQLETEWTGGTLINADFGSATTQASNITGCEFDFKSNVTGANNLDATGYKILLPALTQTSGDTTYFTGFNVAAPGALIQNTDTGTINWNGLNLSLPALTQTTGTVAVNAIQITPGSYTSGTERGIYFASDPNDGAIVSAADLTLITGGGFNLTGTVGLGVSADSGINLWVDNDLTGNNKTDIYTNSTFTHDAGSQTSLGLNISNTFVGTGESGSNAYGIKIDAAFTDIDGEAYSLYTVTGDNRFGHLEMKRFTDTVTLDTGDAETAVGLTPSATIISAAIRVSTQIDGLDSADHHIQLGINGSADKYIDVAQGGASTSISVNKKGNYVFDPSDGVESAALVFTITGGSDQTPTAGAVEVEVVYFDSVDIADV